MTHPFTDTGYALGAGKREKMSQYIVCKIRTGGTVIAGTPPTIHADYLAALAEAERLAGSVADADGFLVFKAIARSERTTAPVKTTMLT